MFLTPYHNQTNDDFFRDLFQPRWSKTLFVLFSGIGTSVCLLLIYSIVWFERYGSDQKRTLQVSSLNKKTDSARLLKNIIK